jgi:hypothetical protein
MQGELANLDAAEQAELVRRKEMSPLELVDPAIARIEKVNPRLNAVITPLFDKARSQAQEARRSSLPDGPFREQTQDEAPAERLPWTRRARPPGVVRLPASGPDRPR